MKISKIILIAVILSVFASNVVLAEPNVDITLSPTEPIVGESVKFTANVTNITDITEVRVVIQECKGIDLCFEKTNESMDEVNGLYVYELNLDHLDATIIKYHIETYNQTEMYKTETFQKDLKENTDTNDGTNSNGDDNDAPGFEILVLIIAFSIMLFIYKKRLK